MMEDEKKKETCKFTCSLQVWRNQRITGLLLRSMRFLLDPVSQFYKLDYTSK